MPRPKSPGGNRPGGSGDGSGKPPQRHGSVDAGKGVSSAQEAAAQAATRGRPTGAGRSTTPGGPTPPPVQPDFTNPKFDDRKLTEYALNPDHPVGRHKAKVIEASTGLGRDDADLVKQQILGQVGQGPPVAGKVDEHGSRWNRDVTLTGPNGSVVVRTAWIVDATTGETRLVTVSFP